MESSLIALRDLVGHLLTAAEGLIYLSSGEAIISLDNLSEVQMKLGANRIRFHCAGDGQSIVIAEGELRPADLGEYGELRRLICLICRNSVGF